MFYGAATSQASVITVQDVVVGGGNSAGQAASFLATHAQRVTVLVRGGSLAESMSDDLISTLQHASNIDIRYHAEVVGASGERRPQGLTFLDTSTSTRRYLPAAAVFMMIGAEPLTDWLPEEIRRDPWGYLMTGDVTTPNRAPGAAASRPASPGCTRSVTFTTAPQSGSCPAWGDRSSSDRSTIASPSVRPRPLSMKEHDTMSLPPELSTTRRAPARRSGAADRGSPVRSSRRHQARRPTGWLRRLRRTHTQRGVRHRPHHPERSGRSRRKP